MARIRQVCPYDFCVGGRVQYSRYGFSDFLFIGEIVKIPGADSEIFDAGYGIFSHIIKADAYSFDDIPRSSYIMKNTDKSRSITRFFLFYFQYSIIWKRGRGNEKANLFGCNLHWFYIEY